MHVFAPSAKSRWRSCLRGSAKRPAARLVKRCGVAYDRPRSVTFASAFAATHLAPVDA